MRIRISILMLSILILPILMLAGCSDKPNVPSLHEDETRLATLNPYVGTVVVLRGPLYLVAIASIIASTGFLLRADANHAKIARIAKMIEEKG